MRCDRLSLAKRLGAKLLISEHWSKAVKLLRHPLYRRIALKAYRRSTEIICVSRFLSEKISEATGLKNMVIIPNIIDTGLFRYSPKTVPENGTLRMMCIASWRLPKRLDLIFEALSAFALESERNIELTVAGTGEQADLLRKRQTPVNLKVIWTGYLERTVIAGMFRNTDIFLHASDIETFSVVTAEALATGTPVLASKTGALPELINDTNGLLTENTQAGWLEGIREIVAKKFDYQAIASQNHDKYSSEKIGSSIISLYKKTGN